MNNNNKKPTSQDVAKLAGVSQSAVSRCFTKGASISSRTKLRVIEAAKKLGYKPNISTNLSISSENNGLVGVILPYVTNRYYPEVLAELHEALRIGGYQILLITTDDGEELDEKLMRPYLQEKLIAIVSATKPTDSFVENCNEKKIQVIAYNRNWKIPTTSSVACDHRYGGEMIAQYLDNNKHKNIGLIEGPKGSFVSDERCRGFNSYIKNLKHIKLNTEKGYFTYEGGYQATEKLLKNKNISAIFCAVVIASSTSLSAGIIRLTKPQRSASSASIMRPVKHISMDLDFPIILVRRCDPPAPGQMPILISG